MIDGMLASAGVDPAQWRALTGAYLRMDMRRGGGLARRDRRFASSPLTALLFVTFVSSVALTLASTVLEDPVLFAAFLTTFAAFNTAMVLLVDFTALVVSPDDYRILGSHPISSRTYFAARIAAILAYTLVLGATVAFLPSLALWVIRGLGLRTFAASMVSALACVTSTTLFVIAAYAALLERVHPRRLARALSYLQLATSMLFFGGYYAAMLTFQDSALRMLSMSDVPWLWAIPPSWFAAQPSWTGWMFVLLVALTAAMEYALRLRAREAVGDMEFGW